MEIIKKVKSYIAEYTLLDNKETIIVGVSGGADSMALMDMLVECGYKCIAAHCNFHLRGEESNRDERFVKEYCKKRNIPFVTISFDTKKYMQEKSISLEMAARELRYEWFEKISKEYHSNSIAIAHHLDDSIETILINLIRGTGIKGLTGIKPRNEKIVRPLLCIYRSDINEYITKRRIPFVEDSSNKEDIFIRNKLRLDIIPQLEDINPSVKQSILRTAKNLSGIETIYTDTIEKIKEEIFDGKYIDIALLKKYPQPETILFEILYPLGFNPSIIEDIANSTDSISGKIFHSKGEFYLIKDRERFILEEKSLIDSQVYKIEENTEEIKEPIHLSIRTILKDKDFSITKDKNILYVDYSLLSFPLYIRKWEQGDRFHPFGMKGSKKVSDYFTDNKFSLSQKQNCWLLCTSDNEIIWIIGERGDNKFRISEKTQKVMQIEFKEQE